MVLVIALTLLLRGVSCVHACQFCGMETKNATQSGFVAAFILPMCWTLLLASPSVGSVDGFEDVEDGGTDCRR